MGDKYTDKQVCDILGDNHFSNLLQYILHMFGTMPRSMTEEEIIQYLKMNKQIGIIFKFMPEEVKEWCRKYSEKLCWYDVNCWSNGGFEKRLYDDKVYALSDDFKLEEKQEEVKSGWIECEINENDCFFFEDGHYYHWSEWNTCLTQNHDWLKAFGGWRYKDSQTWYMHPILWLNDHYTTSGYTYEGLEPVVPIKIRFWKGEIK